MTIFFFIEEEVTDDESVVDVCDVDADADVQPETLQNTNNGSSTSKSGMWTFKSDQNRLLLGTIPKQHIRRRYRTIS